MINPDTCSCCGEIWNRQNLKNIPLGKHELHLCPDCYKEYTKPFDKILSELKNLKWDIINENSSAVFLSNTEDIISYVEKYNGFLTEDDFKYIENGEDNGDYSWLKY